MIAHRGKFVAYFRVSTDRQGKSGLGLEAQREVVMKLASLYAFQFAASPEGCTEAIMLAHGLTVELMVDLCIAGLAIATVERMVVGGRMVEIVRMKITEAGRRALETG